MTDTEHGSDDMDVLDFPGADRVRAAGQVSPPRPQAVASALAGVRALIGEASTSAGAGTVDDRPGDELVVSLAPAPGPRRMWSRRRLLLAGAAAAVVGAGVSVPPVLLDKRQGVAQETTAADFLHDVARTAASQPAPTITPYWLTVTTVSYSVDGVRQKPVTGKLWLSRDQIRSQFAGQKVSQQQWPQVGTVLMTGTRGMSLFHNPLAESSDPAPANRPAPEKGTGTYETGWQLGRLIVTWDRLSHLPTDPQMLRKATSGHGKSATADQETFFSAITLLGLSPAGPRLRGAVYDVLADTRHVRLLGRMKDANGRLGTAVELESPQHTRLIIDPSTGVLLESQTAETARRQTFTSTYESQGYVPSLPPVGALHVVEGKGAPRA